MSEKVKYRLVEYLEGVSGQPWFRIEEWLPLVKDWAIRSSGRRDEIRHKWQKLKDNTPTLRVIEECELPLLPSDPQVF
jgi:hypothetical protein